MQLLLGPMSGAKDAAGVDGTFVVLLNKLEQSLVPLHEVPLRLIWLHAAVRQQRGHLCADTTADSESEAQHYNQHMTSSYPILPASSASRKVSRIRH